MTTHTKEHDFILCSDAITPLAYIFTYPISVSCFINALNIIYSSFNGSKVSVLGSLRVIHHFCLRCTLYDSSCVISVMVLRRHV